LGDPPSESPYKELARRGESPLPACFQNRT